MSAIGLWGPFDQPSLGAQLALRVAGAELARRLPDTAVRAFAPFGSTRPIPLDGGEPVEPLDPPTDAHARALGDALDLVVLTGDLAAMTPSGLAAAYGDAPDAMAPYARLLVAGPPGARRAWHAVTLPTDLGASEAAAGCAHVSVTGDRSRAGIPGAVEVPHPALLAPRLFPARVLEKRLAFLRAMGWWPGGDDAPVVVQGAAADAGRAADVAAALAGRAVVALRAEPSDGAFADALAAELPGTAQVPDLAGVEDRVAAVASASAVVATAPAVRALAVAYGRPVAGLDAAGSPAPPEVAAPLADRLDADYDALAALVPGAGAAPLVTGEVAALRGALDARGRRLAAERVALADYVWGLEGEHAGQLARRDAEIEALARENALLRRRWCVRMRAAAGRAARRLRGSG